MELKNGSQNKHWFISEWLVVCFIPCQQMSRQFSICHHEKHNIYIHIAHIQRCNISAVVYNNDARLRKTERNSTCSFNVRQIYIHILHGHGTYVYIYMYPSIHLYTLHTRWKYACVQRSTLDWRIPGRDNRYARSFIELRFTL